jgi:hypothetical protein
MEKTTKPLSAGRSLTRQPRVAMIGKVKVTLHPHPGKGTLSPSLIQKIVESANQNQLTKRA